VKTSVLTREHSNATTPMPPQAMGDVKYMSRIECDLICYEYEDGRKWYLLNIVETCT
jgi:hypothetical protein